MHDLQPDPGQQYSRHPEEDLTDKGIRYQTLAEAMGVSIATVKRMMNKPSLPFDTLLEICHLVGLSFEELLDRTQDAQSRRAVFTQEQDEAFHKSPVSTPFSPTSSGATRR